MGEIEDQFLTREMLQREETRFGVIRGCGTKSVTVSVALHRLCTDGDAWRRVADALKSYV